MVDNKMKNSQALFITNIFKNAFNLINSKKKLCLLIQSTVELNNNQLSFFLPF